MITALDSSVLLAVFNDEPGAARWIERLIAARRAGSLVICPIVYAEVAPSFHSPAQLEARLEVMGVTVSAINNEAAWQAGRVFREYRQAGGPRDRLIPDFLIAAHAIVQTDRLAAVDRGYLRRWFPKLGLLD